MIRRLTARAPVLAPVLLALTLTSACNDAAFQPDTGSATPDGTINEDTALRRSGSDGSPGNSRKGSPASVEVTPDAFTVAIGQQTQVSAVVRNRQGAPLDHPVAWTSSDPAVATVNSRGFVIGVKSGSVLMIATQGEFSDTATAQVNAVIARVDSVVVSPASASLIVGERLSLVARPVDTAGTAIGGRSVTWTSASPAIATVSSGGLVTGVAVGSTTLRASLDGHTTEVPVEVSPVPAVPVAAVAVSPAPATVAVAGSLQLAATTKGADSSALTGRTVTWTSSNDNIVTVSATGLLTGVGGGSATVTATSEGKTGTTAVTVTAGTVVVASVSMNRTSESLAIGATTQLVATAKDAGGNAVTGRTVSWSSTDTGVATVSASGLVEGVAAGSASIRATIDGKVGTTAITVPTATTPPPGNPAPTERVGYYVAPTGSSTGAGTKASPWDLATVLRGGKPVAAGDTVWVRGGTYRGQFTSNLNGNSSRHIVIRQLPGERATIDGTLLVFGSYVTFWGLEIMNSSPASSGAYGVNVKAPGARMINLVVHDAGRSGMGVWNEAPNAVVHGSIIYNNGTVANKDHGIYFNGNSGSKTLSDNIVFNNWQYGLHAYSPVSGELQNIRLDGNVSFNNGSIGPYGHGPDFYVGGSPIANLSITNNMSWRPNDGEMALNVSGGQGLTLTGNRFVGAVSLGSWSGSSQSNNTMWSSTSAPTSGTHVIVRPNGYEAGRANIVAYNWSRSGTVSADLSSVLQPGDTYEIRNAQNFYGAPVASGTYGGGSISLPMTEVRVPTPIGRAAATPRTTGNTFHVFVVIRTN